MALQLVFIFSLPRSGSTLLQRLLAAHPDVATTAEPWLLLPLVSVFNSDIGATEYGYSQAVSAIGEFLENFEGGPETYRDVVANAARELYARAAGHASYFVDKTPRYHLIVDEVMQFFPEAKFLFLWRNPLSVVASIINTWSGNGRWNAYQYKVDLYKGLENLVRAARERAHQNTLAVRYEDVVLDPESTLSRVFEFLGLEFDTAVLQTFVDVQLAGRMGDPTGPAKYKSLSDASVDSWTATLFNPLRRQWAHRYLDWIGRDRLSFMGYEASELHRQIGENRSVFERLPEDVVFQTWGAAHALFDLAGLRRRLADVKRGKLIFSKS